MDISSILVSLTEAKPSDESVFILFDGALFPAMQHIYSYESSPQARPIYYGTRHEGAMDVSPCLYEPKKESKVWACSEEWRDKGVILTSDRPFSDVLSHLQSIISISLPSGQMAYWRFYSPSWLSSVMEVFEKNELTKLTGPISQWAAFMENGWEIYRPCVSKNLPTCEDDGWFHVSNYHLDAWKRFKKKGFIHQLKKRANKELGGRLSESQISDDMEKLFDLAQESGFRKTADIERFIITFLNHPKTKSSAECKAIIEDKNNSPAVRLDRLESVLFGIKKEART